MADLDYTTFASSKGVVQHVCASCKVHCLHYTCTKICILVTLTCKIFQHNRFKMFENPKTSKQLFVIIISELYSSDTCT